MASLDETKQFGGKLQDLIFMVTGGAGKHRLRPDAEERRVRRFKGASLMSSEAAIERLVKKGNDDPTSGMFARCFDLDVSNQETIPSDVYRQIMNGIQKNYGFGCVEFAEALLRSDPEKLRDDITAIAVDFLQDHVGDKPSTFEERAARKFALIQLAGELLQEAEILPGTVREVESIVDWAWENSAGRPELKFGDLVGNAVDRLRTTINGKMGRDIIAIKDKEDTRYHEVKAWYDEQNGEKILYLPIEHVEEWSGGMSKYAEIQKRLRKMDVLIPSSGNNVAWETIPKVVIQRHYRIKLSKFLGTEGGDE